MTSERDKYDETKLQTMEFCSLTSVHLSRNIFNRISGVENTREISFDRGRVMQPNWNEIELLSKWSKTCWFKWLEPTISTATETEDPWDRLLRKRKSFGFPSNFSIFFCIGVVERCSRGFYSIFIYPYTYSSFNHNTKTYFLA